MKIIIANYLNWCNLCHKNSFINVEIFYNFDETKTMRKIHWTDVLGGGEHEHETYDEYSDIPKEDDQAILICKDCLGLMWNAIAKVESILCDSCGKALHVRRVQTDKDRFEYTCEIPIKDENSDAVFCSGECYNEFLSKQ